MPYADGWWFLGMHLFWWLFWVSLFVALFSVVTPVRRKHARSAGRGLDILQRRYASGHFSTEEYERRKRVLQPSRPNGSSSSGANVRLARRYSDRPRGK